MNVSTRRLWAFLITIGLLCTGIGVTLGAPPSTTPGQYLPGDLVENNVYALNGINLGTLGDVGLSRTGVGTMSLGAGQTLSTPNLAITHQAYVNGSTLAAYIVAVAPGGLGSVEVISGNATDLAYKFTTYQATKELLIPGATYTLTAPLVITASTNKNVKLVAEGPVIITTTTGACTGDALIRSDCTDWGTRLTLEGPITFKPVNDMSFGLNLTNIQPYWYGRIMVDGSLEAGANDDALLYLGQKDGGPGASADGGVIEYIALVNRSHTKYNGYFWDENLRIENLYIGCTYADCDTGVRLRGEGISIGNLGYYLGGGKSGNYIISNLSHNLCIDSLFTTFDYAIADGPFIISSTTENYSDWNIQHVSTRMGTSEYMNNATAVDVTDATRKCGEIGTLKEKFDNTDSTKTTPGSSYVEFNAALGRTMDLTPWTEIRLTVQNVVGAGAGTKGIAFYDTTDNTLLCEITWSDTNTRDRTTPWTALNIIGHKEVNYYVKAAAGDISIDGEVVVMLRGWRNVG